MGDCTIRMLTSTRSGRTGAGASRVLFGKHRPVGRRVAAVLLWTAAVTAAGAGVPWLGAAAGVWGWPQPSSWYGVLLGVGAGLIVLFEMALLPRKWLRGRKLGRAQTWMRLHVWLGLVCLPVVLVHAGYGFGGPLPAATLVLFLLVTASGVWGLLMQQWLPEKLLAEVPGETVASQVDRAMRRYAGGTGPDGAGDRTGEAYRLVQELVDVPPALEEQVAPGFRRPAPALLVLSAEPVVTGPPAAALVGFRDRLLLPYLRAGRRSGSPLASRAGAGREFDRLRASVPAAAHPAVDRLEGLADLRRQWDHLRRLSGWLHGWLVVHLPLSVAMTGLMLVHAVRALKYW